MEIVPGIQANKGKIFCPFLLFFAFFFNNLMSQAFGFG